MQCEHQISKNKLLAYLSLMIWAHQHLQEIWVSWGGCLQMEDNRSRNKDKSLFSGLSSRADLEKENGREKWLQVSVFWFPLEAILHIQSPSVAPTPGLGYLIWSWVILSLCYSSYAFYYMSFYPKWFFNTVSQMKISGKKGIPQDEQTNQGISQTPSYLLEGLAARNFLWQVAEDTKTSCKHFHAVNWTAKGKAVEAGFMFPSELAYAPPLLIKSSGSRWEGGRTEVEPWRSSVPHTPTRCHWLV